MAKLETPPCVLGPDHCICQDILQTQFFEGLVAKSIAAVAPMSQAMSLPIRNGLMEREAVGQQGRRKATILEVSSQLLEPRRHRGTKSKLHRQATPNSV